MGFDINKRALFRPKSNALINNILPWIKDAQQFVDQCTQCGDCLTACPEDIIVKGEGGFPSINFELGECDFCGACANICKEPIFNATSSIAWEKKAFISEKCLAIENIYCRSCAESCEAQALTFQLGISAIPKIDNELCTGCGACVAPCPTNAIDIKEFK